LRVLCVQEEVADRLRHMLTEAMAELCVGNPRQLATDMGPVIDQDAQTLIVRHIERMRNAGATIHQLALPAECSSGCFVAPTVIEIASLDQLQREVFGPVIHLLRYQFNELDALLGQINATGYGLTLGIHSRIDETVERIVSGAHVGNIYVNRNIIGAVVGVQPFGGEGKSGTGPKAGGPLYVARMAGVDELPSLLDAEREASPESNLLNGSSWLLPGPTGERNTLRFVPRGKVMCVAHTTDALRAQLKVVATTGNTAVCPEEMRALLAITCAGRVDANGAEVALIESAALGAFPLAAVLCATPADEVLAWRQRMAAREGPLVPVISPSAGGEYVHWRLLAERVVSVNTTAAGGNTALMTLGT
jgi:RHH-type proline utilization regulon transcriptional repressor/proline dehydrogenase/delta 1-pyrroline-5-carboxylate dehydrogenase